MPRDEGDLLSGEGRRGQRWTVRAGLAGVFGVMCLLVAFSLLTQDRVSASAARANSASRLSMLHLDARYRVLLEQSLVRKFRLSPDVSVLTERGTAETQLVGDLQQIAAMSSTPGARAMVARLLAADGDYDEVGYDIIQAVLANDNRLVERLDKTRGEAAFALVDGIVSREAAAAQSHADAAANALAKHNTSAQRAMVIGYALGLGLITLFGLFIVRISSRLHRARAAEFAAMAQMASTDPLTGLRNHRAFHEDLTRELQRNGRGPTAMSLVMLDLDDLKGVNDRLGHQAGDERLRGLADALRTTHRVGDSAFRIGGDEFAVVLTGTRSWGAVEFVQRLAIELSSNVPGATVTAGITEALDTREKDVVIREADLALITAKRSDQSLALYVDDMHAEAHAVIAEDAHHTQTLANALALAVDAKDSYTRSHCQTVSQLCVLIAAELGVDSEKLARIRLAGLLHDVGKIGIPDSILHKPSALTDDEYEKMKSHSTLGAAILEAADMRIEADWVRHHHERIDGAGYPDGLTHRDIPLESRIILVADAFEAMTSDRPYRIAPGQSFAIDELRRNAGTQFDPDIVQALVRRLDNAGARAPFDLVSVGGVQDDDMLDRAHATPSLAAHPRA
jgi:diguanylate cyclase (GGDEF)-like protein/putative nucleotidyltransferase with HDIG domain